MVYEDDGLMIIASMMIIMIIIEPLSHHQFHNGIPGFNENGVMMMA